jgi:hypothetical protein
MLQKQWDGEAGCLINNSYANIFYVHQRDGKNRDGKKAFAVYVYWDPDSQKWLVSVRGLDADIRRSECVVFSRN